MTTINKMKGYGTKVAYSTDGTSYTDLLGQISVTPADVSVEDVDFSDLQSPSQFKEFSPGWGDAGEIPMKLYFDKTQFPVVLGDLTGRTSVYLKVTFPLVGTEVTASKWVSQGYFKKVQIDEVNTDAQNKVTLSCTFKVTGLPVFTAGS